MPPTTAPVLGSAENLTTYEIISRIWPSSGTDKENFIEEQYEPFLEFVKEESAYLQRCSSSLAVPTLDTALSLMEDFRENRNKTRAELVDLISRRFINVANGTVSEYMELAARLWLTLHIRSTGPVDIYVDTIDWPEDQNLESVVKEQTRRLCGRQVHQRHGRVDENFTAAFLSSTCRISICWTNNLADHLKFNKRKKQLTIYQHKICLLHHLEFSEEPIIPKELLEETLDTFELLFPWYHQATSNLLIQHNKPFYGLGRCGRDRILDMEHYLYWGNRLSHLIRAFEGPPTDLRQLIKDQRNLNEWAAFWIAVLVLVLTVVSIVTGSVSTAYAVKQYNLALAQACAAEDSARQLPGFCS